MRLKNIIYLTFLLGFSHCVFPAKKIKSFHQIIKTGQVNILAQSYQTWHSSQRHGFAG